MERWTNTLITLRNKSIYVAKMHYFWCGIALLTIAAILLLQCGGHIDKTMSFRLLGSVYDERNFPLSGVQSSFCGVIKEKYPIEYYCLESVGVSNRAGYLDSQWNYGWNMEYIFKPEWASEEWIIIILKKDGMMDVTVRKKLIELVEEDTNGNKIIDIGKVVMKAK